MKEIKYWYFLLIVFIVVYLGAFLFFRSTVDSRLGFYGDIINASGTIVGVLVAYYIMQSEFLHEKRDKQDQEKRNILLALENEFYAVKRTTLQSDLNILKTFENFYDDEGTEGWLFIKVSLINDSISKYENINSHVESIELYSNHLLENDKLLISCTQFSVKWNELFRDIRQIKLSMELSEVSDIPEPQIKNSIICKKGSELLQAYNELHKQIHSYWSNRRLSKS